MKGKSKAQQAKLKKAKDDTFAINAGENAANEEVMAEEREIRTMQADQVFLSNVRRAVTRRNQLKSAQTHQRNVLHVSCCDLIFI